MDQAFFMPVCHAVLSRMVPREMPPPKPAEVPLTLVTVLSPMA